MRWRPKPRSETPTELSDDHLKALNSLQWYLAKRDHSPHELRQKLKRRYTPAAIEEALEEARFRKWLRTDEELAELWSRALNRKKRSQRYIEGYLRKHKLPIPRVDRDDELDKCRRLLENKFGKTHDFDFDEKGKATRFLRYRGFDFETIKRVLNEKP